MQTNLIRCCLLSCVVRLTLIATSVIADEPLRSMAPQAVSAVDVSADGKFITVGTMAFSHEPNVWQFAPDGSLLKQQRFSPFAPMQVATLSGGQGMAVGLAYSRVTSPDPTVWLGSIEALLSDKLKDDLVEADSRDGEVARWRTGAGAWRDGWAVSQLGELFVRGPDWVFKPPITWMNADGQRIKLRYENGNLLPTSRGARMVASKDGRRVAFGWLTLNEQQPGLPNARDAVNVWQTHPNRRLWSAPPSKQMVAPELPDPAADYPELASNFRLKADAVLTGSIVTGLALSHDGSRVAIVEHAVRSWHRHGPAIGNWDPPIHLLNFVPRHRGRLRIFDGEGHEVLAELLPEAGQFELGFDHSGETLWCWPASWFARGVAGEVWRPTDLPARTLLHVTIPERRIEQVALPDTVTHADVDPTTNSLIVSCSAGCMFLVTPPQAKNAPQRIADLKSPARVTWSNDGSFAIAGTADGRVVRCNRDGQIVWDKAIPVATAPASPLPPAEVVPGVSVYQGGRIAGGEHAYVGDIWILRLRDEVVMIDCGGTSGVATTRERLRSLGIQRVTHILQTHSHGDHCGGAYLWQATGTRIVAPRSAELTVSWLMPMLTDYGIFPPRRVDNPLSLACVGDEAEFTAAGQKFKAVFVPGHSFDLTVYLTELNGKRIAFTGDLGFENQDILHRCWDDAAKARAVLPVIRDKVLAWKPDIVFTGHGVRANGTEFIQKLVDHTEQSLKSCADDQTK